jgi:hypothetical protein
VVVRKTQRPADAYPNLTKLPEKTFRPGYSSKSKSNTPGEPIDVKNGAAFHKADTTQHVPARKNGYSGE